VFAHDQLKHDVQPGRVALAWFRSNRKTDYWWVLITEFRIVFTGL